MEKEEKVLFCNYKDSVEHMAIYDFTSARPQFHNQYCK